MATSGRRPRGRLQVSFDADVWAQEVERLRARGPMRAAAERARGEIAADGVLRTALRACRAEGDDGSRLARGWGRWISCSPGWFGLLAGAERELAAVCQTFTVHQIKEKYGTLRLHAEFDRDDDLPVEVRSAEPDCPSRPELAEILGMTDAGGEGAVGEAWQEAYETVFVPGHEDWSAGLKPSGGPRKDVAQVRTRLAAPRSSSG